MPCEGEGPNSILQNLHKPKPAAHVLKPNLLTARRVTKTGYPQNGMSQAPGALSNKQQRNPVPKKMDAKCRCHGGPLASTYARGMCVPAFTYTNTLAHEDFESYWPPLLSILTNLHQMLSSAHSRTPAFSGSVTRLPSVATKNKNKIFNFFFCPLRL